MVCKFGRAAGECGLAVDGKVPSWELFRFGNELYNGKRIAPAMKLRFVPDTEDDFIVRGNSGTLLYKGKNISHRWTVLDGSNFEYDVILKKPPPSNTVTLLLENADKYDFLRQPDFVKNPLLKGSYAVYLKEIPVGIGTGKLCHIHRPKIIDASGKTVWGDLIISGSKLVITIPENYLSEARYPVTVDPVIGLSGIGAHFEWDKDDEGELNMLFFEYELPVNRYLAEQTISGTYTAYFYCVKTTVENTNTGYPMLFSDQNGKPYHRLSKNEAAVNFRTGTNMWVSGSFTTNSTIGAGSYVWFGPVLNPAWGPFFDYGYKLYHEEFRYRGTLPETYPDYAYLNDENTYNLRLSMYFQYGTERQDYVRTITQGITLSDSAARKASVRRAVNTVLKITDAAARKASVKRAVNTVLKITDAAARKASVKRAMNTVLKITDAAARKMSVKRAVNTVLKITDSIPKRIFFERTLEAKTDIADGAKKTAAYKRTLADYCLSGGIANSMRRIALLITGTVKIQDFRKRNFTITRKVTDGIFAAAPLSRRVKIIVKLFTSSMIRDYVKAKFSVSREIMKLKSRIRKLLRMDSSIR